MKRATLSAGLLPVAVFVSACAAAGTCGQTAHERHMTGMESQAGD